MSCEKDAQIATADALTLLLHNQHALAAAVEEITKWLSENGATNAPINAEAALDVLDKNARSITEAILTLRRV